MGWDSEILRWVFMEEEGEADDGVQVLAPGHPQPSEGGEPRSRFDALLLL